MPLPSILLSVPICPHSDFDPYFVLLNRHSGATFPLPNQVMVSYHGIPNLRCYRPVYIEAYAAQADALHLRHPAIAYRMRASPCFAAYPVIGCLPASATEAIQVKRANKRFPCWSGLCGHCVITSYSIHYTKLYERMET